MRNALMVAPSVLIFCGRIANPEPSSPVPTDLVSESELVQPLPKTAQQAPVASATHRRINV